MPDIPILGQNGRGETIPTIARAYYVQLSTADGESHILEVKFNLPTGPDGAVQLDALKGFDPGNAARDNIIKVVSDSRRGATISFCSEGGRHVFWHQVVSWQMLGEASLFEIDVWGQAVPVASDGDTLPPLRVLSVDES